MAYTTDGRVWPKSRCELSVTGPGWPAAWKNIAAVAMNTWNAAGANFSFASSSTASDHLAAYDLGRWNGWLAMTNTQPKTPRTQLTGGYVLINLHYEWDPKHPSVPHSATGGPYDLESVLVHELGHLLHLDDDATAKDVMQGTINPGVVRRGLGSDDVAGIKYLYPMLSGLEIADLAREALAIAYGRVVACEYAVVSLRLPQDENAPRLVFSVHRVRVDRAIKGVNGLNGEIDVLTLGGQSPTLSVHVESEAALAPNEEVVLFLSRDHQALGKNQPLTHWNLELNFAPLFYPLDKQSFSVFGGYQGKYSVYRRGDTAYVWRPGMHVSSDPGLSLDALESQIKKRL